MNSIPVVGVLRPSRFLHLGRDQIYNPLTDQTLSAGQPGYDELRQLLAGRLADHDLDPQVRDALDEDRWIVRDDADESTLFHLKYVSLEAHSLCNQSCYFCPVSVDPRAPHFMPTDMYQAIVTQLEEFRSTIQAVFMINYNEPTADRRFVQQVRSLKQAGLPPAVLTNGSGLTPARVDDIVAMGGLRFLCVNLSTLDPDRYKADRGEDHLDLVLRHLDYAAPLEVAEEMEIVVLGTGDERHREDFELITERFRGGRFRMKFSRVMDRAGYLEVGLQARHQKLCGCENVGSRPLQHLHITPHGKCVLCCEDYDEKYEVGDLNHSTVAQVLQGAELARMRRWAYGLEEAPPDFLCRHCVYARTQ